MSLQGFLLDGPLSYNATAAFATENLLAMLDTAGGVTPCGAGLIPAGVCPSAHAINTTATVYPTRGRALVIASAQIAAGDMVKAAAAGQVAPEANVVVATAFTIGVAETAAAGQGSSFWMVWK